MEDILIKLGYLAGATRFRRISEKMYIDGDKLYSDAGIKFRASWFSVYYVLSKTDAPLKVTEIAGQIDFTHITVKNILRQLEGEGLVLIKSNLEDKRSKLVTLSPKGKRLKKELESLWVRISDALKDVFISGHPDISNILSRIENELVKVPVNRRILNPGKDGIDILDYKPSFKKYFNQLVAPWLMSLSNGELKEDEKFLLDNPDKEIIEKGGFIFFAEYKSEIVGCVTLRRLAEETLELENLVTHPNYRNLGIETKLIERAITRCKENNIEKLWFQTGIISEKELEFYYKLGFKDSEPAEQMVVMPVTKKNMRIDL